jgi:glyoxylate/hydroxypyruvate reductase
MTILLATNFDADEQAQWLALLRAALPGETLVTERSAGDDSLIDIAIVANPGPGALFCLPRPPLIQ